MIEVLILLATIMAVALVLFFSLKKNESSSKSMSAMGAGGYITCNDGKTKCAVTQNGATCCPKSDGTYGCCPLADGVCHGDGGCCPYWAPNYNGTICTA